MASEWKYISAVEYCGKVTDGTHDSPKRKERGRPLITSKHIKGHSIDFETAYLISEEDFNKINLRSNVEQWNVLISMIGEYCGYCYVETNTTINYAVKNLGIFKTNDEFQAKWLYYYLDSPEGRATLKSLRSGTSQPYLSLGVLRSLPIRVTDRKATMNEIVTILSALDDKIELNRQTNEALEEMAKVIFKEWFVNFNYPGATGKMQESELGEIPQGWCVVAIGELFDFVIGGDWGKEVASEDFPEECYVIRGTDFSSIVEGNIEKVPKRFIKKSNFKKRKLQPGDILLEISGGSTNQATGRNILITEDLLNLFNAPVIPASFCRLIRPDSLRLSTFLAIYLKDLYDRGGTWDYQLQSTGISNFQFQFFAEKEVLVLPPDYILTQFEEIMDPIIKINGNAINEIQQLTNIRDSLLPKLMTGEIEL